MYNARVMFPTLGSMRFLRYTSQKTQHCMRGMHSVRTVNVLMAPHEEGYSTGPSLPRSEGPARSNRNPWEYGGVVGWTAAVICSCCRYGSGHLVVPPRQGGWRAPWPGPWPDAPATREWRRM
eukprot:6058880-Pyramimonas_sp.AAC.1